MLPGLAKQAKAEGRKAIKVFNYFHHDIVGETAEEYLRPYSIALVTAAVPVMISTTPDEILSWQRAYLERMLRVGPQQKDRDFDQPDFCRSLPMPAGLRRIGGREIALVNPGGTVSIDGIDVTIETGYVLDLADRRKYLLLGLNCGAVLYLNGGVDHVFAVDDNGNVTWAGHDNGAYAQKLLQLKTVSAIERYVRGLK